MLTVRRFWLSEHFFCFLFVLILGCDRVRVFEIYPPLIGVSSGDFVDSVAPSVWWRRRPSLNSSFDIRNNEGKKEEHKHAHSLVHIVDFSLPTCDILDDVVFVKRHNRTLFINFLSKKTRQYKFIYYYYYYYYSNDDDDDDFDWWAQAVFFPIRECPRLSTWQWSCCIT